MAKVRATVPVIVLRPFSFLYLISKCAFYLFQLRLNDELAIGRVLMCCKVVAVVVLRRVKFHQRINRGYNLLPLALFYIFLCFFLLSLIVVENYRAVLWSHVIALPVTRCGIMRNKKHIKEFAVYGDAWVVANLHRFHKICLLCAHFFIGRLRLCILKITRRIAGHYRTHSLKHCKHCLRAPKTSPTKNCFLFYGHFLPST